MAFVTGLIAHYYIFEGVNKKYIRFNYTKEDSLFESAGKNLNVKNQINVDSKQELLDFSNNKLKNRNKSAEILKPKSININTASVSTLVKLPGVGNIIAIEIVKFRHNVKKFGSLTDLLEVKGIGIKKYNKIKKYLFIKK